MSELSLQCSGRLSSLQPTCAVQGLSSCVAQTVLSQRHGRRGDGDGAVSPSVRKTSWGDPVDRSLHEEEKARGPGW